MSTAYALVQSPQHVFPEHPERPGRFDVLRPQLESIEAEALKIAPATMEEIGRVHRPEMVTSLEEACRQGESIIDFAPTFVTRSSFEDALLAAGATLCCTRAVIAGRASNAFSIVRPPGHHAEPERAMGFCLFNNVAIAARDALDSGLKRVAVVDYDAHHGNGTQAAFSPDERVAYLSTHQWGIYPGTGWFEEAADARKRIVNVPLPAGSGDGVYARIAQEIMAPFIRNFRPQLILVSAGFDAHWNDPLTTLGLSTMGFSMLSKSLVDLAREVADGRIVFVLEGGYDPINLANGVRAVFAALMGRDFTGAYDPNPRKEPDASERLEAIKAWHGF